MTLKNIASTVKNFSNSTHGSIMPIFAVCIPVILGTAGLAIDYSKVSNEKTKLESALDSTILNVGSQLFKKSNAGTDYQQKFEDMLYANLVGRGLGHAYKLESFSADKDTGEIYAKVSAHLDTSFMGIFGIDTVKVETESTATINQQKTEITIMLDATGSMYGDKMKALKSAAIKAVDIFLKDSDKDVRVGLVPYSSGVNLGKNKAEIVTQYNTQVASLSGFDEPLNNVPTTRCVTERGGRERATDASYGAHPIGSHYKVVNGNACPNTKILPLTKNKSKLKQRINAMNAKGGTAGHLGIAWSYYMLSDKWNGLWNKSAEPVAYGKAKKVAIIMTDGEFNRAFEPLGGGSEVQRSNRLAFELCENMKAQKDGKEGITVYSIAFSAPQSAQTLLKSCANEDTDKDTFYYSAESKKELEVAFTAIAKSISTLRLSK